MKQLLSLLTTIFITIMANGQNGTIVEKKELTIPDSILQTIRRQDSVLYKQLSGISFYQIVYLSDGLKVVGYLAEPTKTGKYPCIIYNRGGVGNNSKLNIYSVSQVLGKIASWGYIVLATQYRGNDGGEGKEEYGGSDVNDIMNLVTTFSFLENADTSRIGMYGSSRGGMMTYIALKKSCRFKAAIITSGITDVLGNLKRRDSAGYEKIYSEFIPNYKQNREDLLKERSALYWAENLCKTTPLLILHGSADRVAPPQTIIEFTNKLIQEKHPVRFFLFEGGQHNLSHYSEKLTIEVKSFFDYYVKNGNKWPSLEPR